MSPVFTRRVVLPVPPEVAFDWHERPGAFARLSPPWQSVQVLAAQGGIRDGATVTLDLGAPAGRWSLRHEGYVAGRRFMDRQTAGPFASWLHTHDFTPAPGGCELIDSIEYTLPLAPFSGVARGFVESQLDALFAWRHRVTRLDLERFVAQGAARRTIAVTGASGMIGHALVAYLSTQGHTVKTLVRRAARGPNEIAWDPARGSLAPGALAGVDAVVHLAGAGIADEPWSEARKRELLDSRVQSTALLARALAAGEGPRVFVSASAIGIYGDRGDEALDERSARGTGFLGDLAARWEDAAEPAAAAGVRVVHPRISLVLWPQGGALPKLITPTQFGAGGPLGSGRQWWSWVTLHDLLDMIAFAIREPVSGAFNATAPQSVRQCEFASALGRVMSRPSFAPAPAFALRALLGAELADAVLLAGQRLTPRVLQDHGYVWRDPELEPALRGLLGHAAKVRV
jgi:hypothetical protein